MSGPTTKSKKTDQEDSKPIAAVLLAIAALVGYLGLKEMAPNEAGPVLTTTGKLNTPDDRYERRVNEHLRAVDIKRQFEAEKMQIENHVKAPSLHKAEKQYSHYFEKEYGVSLDQEGLEERVHEDLDPESLNPTYESSPHSDVQARLLASQRAAHEAEVRLAQAKSVAIERARREGYLIELDDNMVVTKVQKLRSPQSTASERGVADESRSGSVH